MPGSSRPFGFGKRALTVSVPVFWASARSAWTMRPSIGYVEPSESLTVTSSGLPEPLCMDWMLRNFRYSASEILNCTKTGSIVPMVTRFVLPAVANVPTATSSTDTCPDIGA